MTLADVARRAGVAPITASRALTGGDLVAGPTRDRILAAATELGYRPNILARGLVQNRTTTVGNPFFERSQHKRGLPGRRPPRHEAGRWGRG